MKKQTRCDLMESLVEERRKELKREQVLESELKALLQEKETLLNGGMRREDLAALEEKIARLTQEREESLKKRKNLCSLAQVVGAGD